MPSKTYNERLDRQNSIAALARDHYECVWCLHVLGMHSKGSVPHHIFGRRRNFSADAQITLCMQRSRPDAKGNSLGCHARFETAYLDTDGKIEITKDKLIDLMKQVYNIKLERYY